MNLLAVDTSTMLGSVALLTGDGVISLHQDVKSTHSDWLFKNIEKILRKADLLFKDLNGLAVAIGPGSFTGLRIGISAVKGIALSLGLKVIPFSSLYALALMAKDSPTPYILSAIDAKRGELYFAIYKNNSELETVEAESALPPDMVIRKIQNMNEKITLVGDGIEAYLDPFKGAGKNFVIDKRFFRSDMTGLLKVAKIDFEKGRGVDPSELKANYIRPSDAEKAIVGAV